MTWRGNCPTRLDPGRWWSSAADLRSHMEGHNVDSRWERMGLAQCAVEICALRGDPPSIDGWLWISRTWPCEMARWTRSVRGDPSRHRRSGSAIDGLVDDRH